MTFSTFSLHPKIAAGVAAAGYTTPTPIQTQAIPKILQGGDLVGLAQTGTGKTAAFALPILHRLMGGQRGQLRALVIAPTRELAEQIHQSFESLGNRTGLRSTTVYGGVGIQRQVNSLKRADIVVACPGRLIDHIERGTVDLSKVDILVLDEADQMFDMGFLPAIRKIIRHLPKNRRQTLLFSATMPDQIRKLTQEILNRPQWVQSAHDKPADTVSHSFYPVAKHLKTALLFKLLDREQMGSTLIFTRTKHKARQLGARLAKRGFCSTSLQGNLSQPQRLKAMNGFKSGQYKILVATDIAARGIDVSDVTHVINFDMPSTAETYIHRIGRTGRAERNGEAMTLFSDEDKPMVKAIRRTIEGSARELRLEDFDYRAPNPHSNGQNTNGQNTNSRNTNSRNANSRNANSRNANSRNAKGRNAKGPTGNSRSPKVQRGKAVKQKKRRAANGVFEWLSPAKEKLAEAH